MKFLADENFPLPAVVGLRGAGFDIESIGDAQPGASDEEVLARCRAENGTLLTFGKDFDEMAFRQGMPAECGIILFRVVPKSPNEVTAITLAAIRSRSDWTGHFSVASRSRIRMTPLPA